MQYDSTGLCDFDDVESLAPELRATVVATDEEVRRLSDYDVASGHFCWGTLSRVAPPSSVATVLREPRARILSLYAYWRLTPFLRDLWHPYAAVEHALRPLDEFLLEPRIARATDNQVCRLLLYGDPRIPDLDFIAPADAEAIADSAIERLDALGFVGIIEMSDAVWSGLARMFGVELTPLRHNVTGERGCVGSAVPLEAPITDRTLDLIAQRTAADTIVYEHALEQAGLGRHEAQALRDTAFAQQLVRFGDLVCSPAAKAVGVAQAIEGHEHELDSPRLIRADVEELRGQLRVRDRELEGLRQLNEAMRRSISWRLTVPLRAAKRRANHTRTHRAPSETVAARGFIARRRLARLVRAKQLRDDRAPSADGG
jgi:hypothetical protein